MKIRFSTNRGGEAYLTVPFRPSGATLGRVTVKEFFAPNSGLSLGMLTLDPVPDCHHRNQATRLTSPLEFDFYGSVVGGLALIRESMYHHARRTDELGISYLRGGAWIVAVVAFIVAVILIALGASGKLSVQVCQTQPDGTQVCAPVQPQSQTLSTEWADILIAAAAALAGITCDVIGGNCSAQSLQVVPIQM